MKLPGIKKRKKSQERKIREYEFLLKRFELS